MTMVGQDCATPGRFGSAAESGRQAQLEPMAPHWLDQVLAIEQGSYGQPWTRGNFADSLAVGHYAQCLAIRGELIGYCVAMAGWREAHLLNLTVAPDWRRQGWARVLLEALRLWARAGGAESLWLEVRSGNLRARAVYERSGFKEVGLRKSYYRLGRGRHEDAVLMCLQLAGDAP